MKLKFQIRILYLMYGHGNYGVNFHFLHDWTPRFSIKCWRINLDFTLHLHWDSKRGDQRWFKAFFLK